LAATFLIGGCATIVDRPPAFTGAQRDTGLSYAEGVDYLNSAHRNLQDALSGVDRFDGITKAGAGVGAGGAGISAVFHSGIDLILGFLTLGALSYAANQLIDPQTLGGIYSAGIANLDCIDEAAATAHRAMAPTAADLIVRRKNLIDAIADLRSDVKAAGAQSKYAIDVEQATANIASADAARKEIDKYLSASDIAESMLAAVNATISAVNQQVRAKSPSIDAITQAGSIFSSVTNAGSSLKAQMDLARTQVASTTKAETQGAKDSLEESFAAHEKSLRDALSKIPTNFDTPSVAAIARCNAQFAGETPVGIQPPGPIDLNAGSSVSLNLPGKTSYRLIWIGDIPADVDANMDPDYLKLSAHADAKEHRYTFKVVDIASKSSPDVQINVHAKSNTVVPPQQSPSVAPAPAVQPKPTQHPRALMQQGPPPPPPDRHLPGT